MAVAPYDGHDIVASTQKMSRELFLKLGMINPVYFLETEIDPVDGAKGHWILIVETRFQGPDHDAVQASKKDFSTFITQLCRKCKARSSTFVTEAWAVAEKNGKLPKPGNLSEHPKRQEIVFVIHEIYGEPTKGWCAEIEDHEGVRIVGEFETFKPVDGMFFNVLSREGERV
jgi:hypothetical protein